MSRQPKLYVTYRWTNGPTLSWRCKIASKKLFRRSLLHRLVVRQCAREASEAGSSPAVNLGGSRGVKGHLKRVFHHEGQKRFIIIFKGCSPQCYRKFADWFRSITGRVNRCDFWRLRYISVLTSPIWATGRTYRRTHVIKFVKSYVFQA